MSEIDAAAFSEWVLSKAVRAHEAHEDAANKRIVADAVKRAIANSEDEVHITCTLRGASGSVEVDEQMSRTAAENLFAVVHVNAPRTKHEATDVEKSPEKPDESESRILGMEVGTFAIVVILLISAGIIVSMAVLGERSRNAREHEHEHHEKSESRH